MIKSKKTGQLIVISAPSGAGKDTVVKELMKEYGENKWVSVSATSRDARPGEKEGVDYFYLTKEEFEKNIEEGFFLEYTNYAGNYYGTPKKYIKEKLDQGIDVILIIEIEGAMNVKKLVPEALFIFIMPPSIKELVRRLKTRGTETNEKISAILSEDVIEDLKETAKNLNSLSLLQMKKVLLTIGTNRDTFLLNLKY